MEAIVNEVIRRKRTEKIKNVKKETNSNLDVPQTTLYRRSYEVSNRIIIGPICPLKKSAAGYLVI